MFLSLGELFKCLNTTPTSRNFQEGEAVLNANHIVLCGKSSESSKKDLNVVALCLQTSSLLGQPHEINVKFKINRNSQTPLVQEKSCTCKAGQGGQCKHIAAVLLHCTRVNIQLLEDVAKTQLKCLWSQKKGRALGQYKPKPISERSCCSSNGGEEKMSVVYSDDELRDFYGKAFKLLPNCALTKSLNNNIKDKPKNETEFSQKTDIEEHIINIIEATKRSQLMNLLYNIDFHLKYECCLKTYNNIYPCNAEDICYQTFTDKNKWQRERQFRITASRCYELYTYGKDEWAGKVAKYFWPRKFENVYMKHGIDSEKFARTEYEKIENCKVTEVGLIVSQANPWIAFSPDGVILEDNRPKKLLEIKCPWQGKENTIEDCISSCNYLNKDRNGMVILKKKHKYFAQVQLGMAILGIANISSGDRGFDSGSSVQSSAIVSSLFSEQQ